MRKHFNWHTIKFDRNSILHSSHDCQQQQDRRKTHTIPPPSSIGAISKQCLHLQKKNKTLSANINKNLRPARNNFAWVHGKGMIFLRPYDWWTPFNCCCLWLFGLLWKIEVIYKLLPFAIDRSDRSVDRCVLCCFASPPAVIKQQQKQPSTLICIYLSHWMQCERSTSDGHASAARI